MQVLFFKLKILKKWGLLTSMTLRVAPNTEEKEEEEGEREGKMEEKEGGGGSGGETN